MKDINDNYIGSNIQFLRQMQRLSQEQFGKTFDVSRHSIANYEEGRSTPNALLVFKICHAYGVPFEAFVKQDFHSMQVPPTMDRINDDLNALLNDTLSKNDQLEDRLTIMESLVKEKDRVIQMMEQNMRIQSSMLQSKSSTTTE